MGKFSTIQITHEFKEYLKNLKDPSLSFEDFLKLNYEDYTYENNGLSGEEEKE